VDKINIPAQAKGMVIHKNLNRIHKPEAQANGMVIMLVINKNPSLALQAYINIKISVKRAKYDL
jgi:hypothetical protein